MSIKVTGGNKVNGTINVFGAKNSILNLLVACCLTNSVVSFNNLPLISDVINLIKLIESIGGLVTYHSANSCSINTQNITNIITENSYVHTSTLLCGVLLGRFKSCVVPLPNGDKIGTRALDIHFDGLRKMGAHMEIKDGFIHANAQALYGIEYILPFASVGASQHLIMTAALASGRSIFYNVSIEPETIELCLFLQSLGVNIDGIGSSKITIYGSNHTLYSGENIQFDIMTDRILSMTYLLIPLFTGGQITIRGKKILECCNVFLEYLTLLGAQLTIVNKNHYTEITSEFHGHEQKVDNIIMKTAVFPGLPTDIHPQLFTASCLRGNVSSCTETLFNGRFKYGQELIKMGANITINNNTIHSQGINMFSSAEVVAHDIRGGMSCVLAALNAPGTSIIKNFYQVRRGYPNLINTLQKVGLDIHYLMEG